MALVHHELCFGCGRVNLFGLLLELDAAGPDAVAGRGFLKQDHQGADRRHAHEGVVAAALLDAMALACGADARVTALEISYGDPAPVGTFLEVEARVERRDGPSADASATARVEQCMVAQARGRYQV